MNLYFDPQNPPPSRDTQADLDRIPNHFAAVVAAFDRERALEAEERATAVETAARWLADIARHASEVQHLSSVEADAITRLSEVAKLMQPHIDAHRAVLAGISDSIDELMVACEEELQEKSRKWWRDV
jgi:hypothetical protein